MKLLRYLFLLLFITGLNGCGQQGNPQNQLQQQLQEKEQQLVVLKKILKQKDDSLQMLKKTSDTSSAEQDTAGLYKPELIGTWRVEMHCIETSCEGSAIGDVKNETWEIAYKGNVVMVKAITSNQVTRVYNGLYKSNYLELTSEEAAGNTIITITLQQPSRNVLEGVREIVRAEKCRIRYAVHLEKLES